MFQKRKGDGEVVITLIVVAVIAIIIGVCNLFYMVSSGEVALIKKGGVIQDKAVGAGIHTKTPVLDEVVIINVRNQAVADGKDKYLKTAVRTRDNQKINVTYDILYNIPEKDASRIYVKYGGDIVSNYLFSYTQTVLNSVIGQYTASEVMTKRDEVRQEIIDRVTAKVFDKELKCNIANIVDIPFTQVDFSASYDKVLEDKQKALEESRKKTYQLQSAIIDAKITQTRAKAEADAIRVKAEAVKNSPQLIELEKVKVQMKIAEQWDGKSVPQTVFTTDGKASGVNLLLPMAK